MTTPGVFFTSSYFSSILFNVTVPVPFVTTLTLFPPNCTPKEAFVVVSIPSLYAWENSSKFQTTHRFTSCSKRATLKWEGGAKPEFRFKTCHFDTRWRHSESEMSKWHFTHLFGDENWFFFSFNLRPSFACLTDNWIIRFFMPRFLLYKWQRPSSDLKFRWIFKLRTGADLEEAKDWVGLVCHAKQKMYSTELSHWKDLLSVNLTFSCQSSDTRLEFDNIRLIYNSVKWTEEEIMSPLTWKMDTIKRRAWISLSCLDLVSTVQQKIYRHDEKNASLTDLHTHLTTPKMEILRVLHSPSSSA